MTLTLADILFVAVVGSVGFYWFNGIKVRELAIHAARRSTVTADLQLLDQTVSQAKVSLSKDRDGRWRIWRQFRFEYSRDGVTRETGQIIMLGNVLQAVVIAEAPTVH